ncbi:MAG: hypothetical protein KF729_15155 [Sandaracinaceae bacterium]|nr:hypothetical protein [Sandaracinaceae bacterium]
MRWPTLSLCFALVTLPGLAAAQAAGEPPDDEEPAADEPDEGPTGPREATTADPMPERGTSSVVIDQREAALRREQAEFQEQERREGDTAGPAREDDGDGLHHEYQVGLRVGVGVPFLFALRYNNGPRCSAVDPPEAFCLLVGSTAITFDLSFGVSRDIEIVVGGRIGAIVSAPTETNHAQILAGIRAYLGPDSIFKAYLAPSVVLDVTPNGLIPNWGDVDFGVRGAFGVQVDPIRFLGIYAEIGVNILFLRSFAISPDLSGGLQVRFP